MPDGAPNRREPTREEAITAPAQYYWAGCLFPDGALFYSPADPALFRPQKFRCRNLPVPMNDSRQSSLLSDA